MKSILSNVLIVDDNPSDLVALKAAVQDLAYATTVKSGREALEELARSEYALVLLDVNMPVLGGLETAGLIRSGEQGKATPIIFMTSANYLEELVIRGYSLGAVDFIFKPVHIEILRAKVKIFVELFQMRKRLEILNEESERANRKLAEEIRNRIVASQQKRESEEDFRAIADSAVDCIVCADGQGKIFYINKAGQKLFGYSNEEAVGSSVTMLMPMRFHQDHLEGLQRFAETGESRLLGQTVPLIGRKNDGTEFPMELSLGSWEKGKSKCFVAIVRPVNR